MVSCALRVVGYVVALERNEKENIDYTEVRIANRLDFVVRCGLWSRQISTNTPQIAGSEYCEVCLLDDFEYNRGDARPSRWWVGVSRNRFSRSSRITAFLWFWSCWSRRWGRISGMKRIGCFWTRRRVETTSKSTILWRKESSSIYCRSSKPTINVKTSKTRSTRLLFVFWGEKWGSESRRSGRRSR